MSRTTICAVIAVATLSLLSACADETAKKERARTEIGIQAGQLMNTTNVPRDQAAFDKATAIAGCPEDPWGHPYAYERLGTRKIRISSKGKDGKLGTPDDVAEDLTFPTGSGLEDLSILRDDGARAIKSPDGKRTFWTTQKTDDKGNQVTDWWLGDEKAVAAKPVKTDSVDDEWRRNVTLIRWSKDGRFVDVKDVVLPNRPDGSSPKEARILMDVTTAKVVGTSAAPSDSSAWLEY
jgi:hypothetical protein